MMPRLGEPPTTPAHRHSPLPEPALHPNQARLKMLQPLLLGPPLLLGGIPPGPAGPPIDRDRQPPVDHPDRSMQACAGVQEVAPAAAPLVVAGPGDRPRPSRRRCRSQGALAAGTAVGARPHRAAAREIAAGQPAQILADHVEHRGVLLAGPQPGLHPRTGGRGDHERRGDRTHDRII
jgi:hypothetical protein